MRQNREHLRRVKASSSPGRRHHLISPGIACYVCAPLSPPKQVKFHATPGEEEFRCHLDAGAEPGKGTTKTVSELVVFSDCLACCPAASSM